MGNIKTVLFSFAVLFFVSACSSTQGQQEETGALVGGALGGLIGAQVGDGSGTTAAIILGTLIGSDIGRNIGRTMDEVDRMRMAQALETQRTGSSIRWRNPDSAAAYSVTPTRTYETGGGPCREFVMRATIGDVQDSVVGTACRSSNGVWRIQ